VKNKIPALFFALLIIHSLTAQTKKTEVKPAKQNQHLEVYNLALNTGDLGSAVVALNYYINEKGSNTPYADTLALLYMQQGFYPQCLYWADKRLITNSENNSLLEMKGVCLDKLRQPKEAIEIFEKLFKKTQNPYHAYKLLELQYNIKRLTECLATAEAAEKLTYKPEYTMTYNYGEQTGRTYLQAGVYNIHALALYSSDKKAEAKKYFEKALEMDSTFALAKENLQTILALEKGKTDNVVPPADNQNANPKK
jgi:tetratricopeptide (TPR) repeat protein